MPKQNQPKNQTNPQAASSAAVGGAAGQQATEQNYLNHGVESLVAMDNPDDAQETGAETPSGREPR